MDLRSLRYFVATVETGSISSASNRCHVAQPSITMAIAKLEDELNCKLFDRHRKGSSPTPDGDRMYLMATELLQHADSIKQQFAKVEQVHRVTLSVDKNIRINTLETLLARPKCEFNSYQFEILSDASSGSLNNKIQKQADLRLTTLNQCDKSETFISLGFEEYALLIPNNNLLAHQKKLSLNDLNEQNFIERIYCENQALFDQTISQFGLNIHTVAKVESEEWAHALVGTGLGLTFAPVPKDFTDPRFTVRFLSEWLSIKTPNREVGLAIKKSKMAELEAILPSLIM
ncbi:MAG: DNA-binding transcriptional LysR family regulator [Oleiphilaceae bacterium]|jgi:DNA-binding transcriptional LysR family regulator